jgi:uncharacterized membrane protein YfcA
VIELGIQAAVGLVAGLLGGLLGIGGSVIIIPAMVEYFSRTGVYTGQQQHLIQAAAMLCNACIAAPSTLAHWRARAILVGLIRVLIPFALAGMFLGVMLSNTRLFARQNGAYLTMLLAAFLMYVAAHNLRAYFRKSQQQPEDEPRPAVPAWRVAAVGLPMGLVAGLLGVGGGILAVPLQQVFLRIPLRRAIANSSATIVCTALAGAIYKNLSLAQHGILVADSLRLAVAIIPTAMLGGYLGGRLTHILPRRILLWVFIIFMTVMSVRTFYHGWEAALAARMP